MTMTEEDNTAAPYVPNLGATIDLRQRTHMMGCSLIPTRQGDGFEFELRSLAYTPNEQRYHWSVKRIDSDMCLG
jgi:hypothetical protein